MQPDLLKSSRIFILVPSVEMVIRQIEASGQHEPETVTLQTELITRESTAPVKETASV